MRLNILPIREFAGQSVEFDYTLDLTALELYGERPLGDPARVYGCAQNRADMFELHLTADYSVSTRCARCLREIWQVMQLVIEKPMADSVENLDDENSDEIIVLKDGFVDLDELVTEAIILDAQMSYLCRDDCRGLCPVCGCDLNESSCSCETSEPDERLEVLRRFLE